MRAAVIEAMEQLPVVGDMPEPSPGEGEVLVDVTAATLNPVELHIWRGTYRDGAPHVPYVPGIEGVGHVVSGGDLAPGTRVRFEAVGLHPGYGNHGTLAERAIAPAGIVTPLSDEFGDAAVAALGTTGITALRILEVAHVGAGDSVLVLGATGLVGRCAVQLARALGAERVIAAGRDEEGLRRALELGADAAVNMGGRSRAELVDAFREASEDRIDVIVDPVWGEPALAALEAASVDVRHVNVGKVAGDPIALPHALLLRKRATLRGLSTAMDGVEVRRAAFLRLLDHVRAGRLEVDHEAWPLDRIGEAWERSTTSPGKKLVVQIR